MPANRAVVSGWNPLAPNRANGTWEVARSGSSSAADAWPEDLPVGLALRRQRCGQYHDRRETEEELRRLMRDAGCVPKQRDTLYRTYFLN
jgi:hypothetical protein